MNHLAVMATNGICEARTSISCENIPELFLDKLVAKTHFSQFGKIKRFILRPNRLSCTVEYELPEAAQLALEKGGQFKNVAFSIVWTDSKPAPVGENAKPGGAFLDAEVQMELEAIDNARAPSTNLLAYYKTPEQRTAPLSNVRPAAPKLYIPPVASRLEVDPRIGQVRAELEALARKPAATAEERYRVLEAKDRYIRLTTERTTDIRKAKNIEGTCPDMCPEKERYLREWKCMVPSYERQPGGGGSGTSAQIDHVRAIKQYSRSSADQELPLPHELRSQQALGRTMHFLLTNLADLCDMDDTDGGGNVSDWFHYIWDRTRGVRKDITQQDLCSPAVVELVEQCTRFHIHCAARLISEDPSVFDQKINTENMTKCLQTLKYMYTDLAQRGQRCPAEAEFRAYMVLLYLNDGNFLWELRQLPEAIIHSREIQFALSVYFTLEENNFVRFFQLVRTTSYMNACILLRYFTQVRQKALDILRKAYAVRATTSFSLEYLTRILGFEDADEAEAFFDHYGVVVDRASGMVLFEPKQPGQYQPELPFASSRAVRLVESKRNVSVGEAICGRSLKQWGEQFTIALQPKDSFDSNGCLKEKVLQEIYLKRKDTEESVIAPQPGQMKDAGQLVVDASMEEDKVDYVEFGVRSEVTASDERVFKVPSPTTVVPRLSPRARTPEPPKPPAPPVPFVTQHLPSFTSTRGSSHLKAPSFEIPATKPAPVVPTPTFSSSFGSNIFGSVTSISNSASLPPAVDSSKLFGAFPSNSSSSLASGGSLFGSVPSAVTDSNNAMFDLGVMVTRKYESPPMNQSITPPGKKRTFFGAAKEASTPSKPPHSALRPPPPAPTASSPSFFPSTSSLFGSVAGFGGTPATLTGNVPPTSGPVLAGGFFSQASSTIENKENKLTNSITDPIPKVPPTSKSFESEKKEQELKRMQLEQQQLEQQRKRQQERKQAIERAGTVQLEKLLDAVVDEIVPELAEQAVARHKHLQRYPVEVFNELASELLSDQINTVAQEELDRMDRIRATRARKLSKKYFYRWHRNAQRATRWRRLLRTVPPSFVNGCIRMDELPSCDQLRPFLSAQLTDTKRNAKEVLRDQSVRREVYLFDAFPERQLIDPFVPLEATLQQLVPQARSSLLGIAEPIYWKLAISVPVEGEEGSAGFPSFVSRWLDCCSFRKDATDARQASPYFYLASRPPPSKRQEQTVAPHGMHGASEVSQGERAICMRLVRGKAANSEKDTDSARACNLTDGLLFILNADCRVGDARNRIKSVLAKTGSLQPAIAIILYNPNGGVDAASTADLERQLGLTMEVTKRWQVFVWSKATDNVTLRAAVAYLANCYRAHLQHDSPRYEERLEMRPLVDLLERCVGSELWFRLDKACRKSDETLAVGQNANAIVQLYNAAVERVCSMVTQDLKQFVRLPEEFRKLRNASVTEKISGNGLPLPEACFPPDWHSSQRRDRIRQLLKGLVIRPLPDTLQSAIEHTAHLVANQGITIDVSELRAELSNYLSGYRTLLVEDSRALEKLTQQFVQGIVTQLAGFVHKEESRGPEGRRCYWVPLLSVVSETVLRAALTRADASALPVEAFYRRSDFLCHTETDWWREQLLQLQQHEQRTAKASTSMSVASGDTTVSTAALYQSIQSSFLSDRKRTHKELDETNECISNSTSIISDGTCSDSSFNDSFRSDGGGHKRPKVANGRQNERDMFEDVIAKGMKALARAEQLLSQKSTYTSTLQQVFDPLERQIMEVENSCRSIQQQYGGTS
uniref:Germinal-center associated nuclear protein n=1 Tax=Anopheles dirus TaxID=7168 RepID=A0A182NTL8_9DIPT